MEKGAAAAFLTKINSERLPIFRLFDLHLHSSHLREFLITVGFDVANELASNILGAISSGALTECVTFGLELVFKLAHDLFKCRLGNNEFVSIIEVA